MDDEQPGDDDKFIKLHQEMMDDTKDEILDDANLDETESEEALDDKADLNSTQATFYNYPEFKIMNELVSEMDADTKLMNAEFKVDPKEAKLMSEKVSEKASENDEMNSDVSHDIKMDEGETNNKTLFEKLNSEMGATEL